MYKLIFNMATHGAALAVGVALGIYLLPIITAPSAPDAGTLSQSASAAQFKAEFTRDLRGSDFLHWGEGTISLSSTQIVHQGRLAPGPDYKLYLIKDFAQHEDEFLPVKQTAKLIGDVKSFDGFLLDVPAGIDIADYSTVVIWCESFSEFITAAKYR